MPLSRESRLGIYVGAAATFVFLLAVAGVVGLVVLKQRSARSAEDEARRAADRGKAVGLGDEEAARRGRELAKIGRPSAGDEGETWTVRDLVAFLEAKRVVTPYRAAYATPFGMPMVEFVQGGDVVLKAIQCDTAQKSRDLAAGRNAKAHFGWGRFAISGNRGPVEAARRALGAD